MTLNGVMALFCIIAANSGTFRAYCVKVHVQYLISCILVLAVEIRNCYCWPGYGQILGIHQFILE